MVLRHPISVFRNLLVSEAGGGLILMASAVVALIWANSAFSAGYFGLLGTKVAGLSVLHWINDGLMAAFFLLVGLEIKRELMDGQLQQWSQRILPGFAAIGGMLVPGLVYTAVTFGTPAYYRGWAIPAATDIAFSLGVLALLAPRVPVSLKVFLTALAILDDFGAVAIIALFFTEEISPLMLALAAASVVVLFAFNRFGITRLWPYLLVGVALWVFTLKSGVHATVAGVVLAMSIPLRKSPGHPDDMHSPLHILENALHTPVAYFILPIFALANAGVPLRNVELATFTHPVTAGIALGLFVGKQIGVFGGAWLAIKLRIAKRPKGASYRHIYGVALLCGIGFTMSLFIGALAIDSESAQYAIKIGVLTGSLVSAVAGFLVLRFAPSQK
ncbi:MAG TPA: Na+/H+ antiporter NhaA [Xanthobacteraceae bacterium]|nr:Na+/H+ antiporter NhaA [Xanthobacteraceae bacterium]